MFASASGLFRSPHRVLGNARCTSMRIRAVDSDNLAIDDSPLRVLPLMRFGKIGSDAADLNPNPIKSRTPSNTKDSFISL